MPRAQRSGVQRRGECECQSQRGGEPVTLSWFVDDNNVTQARLQGLIDAYKKLQPNVTIEIETQPGGGDGDNIVKTRLVDRRDDRRVLVQLRLAAAGAQPGRRPWST